MEKVVKNSILNVWISIFFLTILFAFVLYFGTDNFWTPTAFIVGDCQPCPIPASQCSETKIQTCTNNITGCGNWSVPTDCPIGESCNATISLCAVINTCANNCNVGKTRCNENKLETCAADSVGCLNWTMPARCEPDYYCPSESPFCILGCNSINDCANGKSCKTRTKLCKKTSVITPENETGEFIIPTESNWTAAPVIKKERVSCVFKGAIGEQTCFSSKGSCKGKISCDVDIIGEQGETVPWNSSCGFPIETRVTGFFKKINFMCVHECSDSDDGVNLDVVGKICAGGYCEEDKCLDEKKVIEKFCSSSRKTIAYNVYPCQYSCKNGACSNTPLPVSLMPKTQSPAVETPVATKHFTNPYAQFTGKKPKFLKIQKTVFRKRSLFVQKMSGQNQ